MKSFICTEIGCWEDGTPKEIKKVFASKQNAIDWVTDSKDKDSNREYEEIDIEQIL